MGQTISRMCGVDLTSHAVAVVRCVARYGLSGRLEQSVFIVTFSTFLCLVGSLSHLECFPRTSEEAVFSSVKLGEVDLLFFL